MFKCCKHAGCSTLVQVTGSSKDSTYCDVHKPKIEEHRGSPASRGYDTHWAKVRLLKLKRNPICELCDSKGYLKPATLVHHICYLRHGGARLDMNNLMSLCIQCHGELHKRI